MQSQLIGTVAVGAFTLTLSLVAWFLIKTIFGLRVDPQDEARGLDISEMGMEAYAGDPIGE